MPHNPHDGFWLLQYSAQGVAGQLHFVVILERGLVRGIGLGGATVDGYMDVDGDALEGTVKLTLTEQDWVVPTHAVTPLNEPNLKPLQVKLRFAGDTCAGYAHPAEGGGRINIEGRRIVLFTDVVKEPAKSEA